MQLHDLKTLLDYHYWARDRVLDAAATLPPDQFTREIESSFRSVRDTLVHVCSAEWAWHSRWTGASPTAHLSAELFPDVATLRSRWRVLEDQVRAFVDRLGDEGIHGVCEYKNFAGQPFASPYWQMVTHLVNHGSYHRGQVATLMRQLGAAPAANLDLIAFYRAQAAGR